MPFYSDFFKWVTLPMFLPSICLLDQFLLTALYISIHKAINKDKLYGKEGKAPRKIQKMGSNFLGAVCQLNPFITHRCMGPCVATLSSQRWLVRDGSSDDADSEVKSILSKYVKKGPQIRHSHFCLKTTKTSLCLLLSHLYFFMHQLRENLEESISQLQTQRRSDGVRSSSASTLHTSDLEAFSGSGMKKMTSRTSDWVLFSKSFWEYESVLLPAIC